MVASLRLYMAISLDGFIATPDGAIDWLAPFDDQDFGYASFFEGVGLLIMGRATFDQILALGPWPYGGRPCWVMSGRPLPEETPDEVSPCAINNAAAIANRARAHGAGDVWIVGGADTAAQFLAAGAVDQIDLFVMPIWLGQGLSLFPAEPPPLMATLARSVAHPAGVAQLTYRVRRPPHAVPDFV